VYVQDVCFHRCLRRLQVRKSAENAIQFITFVLVPTYSDFEYELVEEYNLTCGGSLQAIECCGIANVPIILKGRQQQVMLTLQNLELILGTINDGIFNILLFLTNAQC
jgi:hypothetical protein